MLSDRERLVTIETNITWIKSSLARLELGQKESHKSLEAHLIRAHHNGNGFSGISIQMGRKTAIAIIAALGTSGGTVGAGVLKVLGIF